MCFKEQWHRLEQIFIICVKQQNLYMDPRGTSIFAYLIHIKREYFDICGQSAMEMQA